MTKPEIDLLTWLRERAYQGERMLPNHDLCQILNWPVDTIHKALTSLHDTGEIRIYRQIGNGYTHRKVQVNSTGYCTGWSKRNAMELAALPPDDGRYAPKAVIPKVCPHEELGRRLKGRRYGQRA